MIVSEKEAMYHIPHTEQLFAWGEISKTAFIEKIEYFLSALIGYDYSKYEAERNRINRKYGLDLCESIMCQKLLSPTKYNWFFVLNKEKCW